MIRQRDSYEQKCIAHTPGRQLVLARRQRVGVDVVVAEDDGHRLLRQRRLDDGAHGHLSGIDDAAPDLPAADEAALGIQTQEVDDLGALIQIQRHEIPPRLLARAQEFLLAALGHLIAATDLRDEREQRRHVLPRAGHLHHVLKACLKDRVKRAEMVQQRVRELVDVAPRHSIKQQQLEHAVIVEIIKPAAHEARLHAGAVPVMRAHRTGPRRSPCSPTR